MARAGSTALLLRLVPGATSQPVALAKRRGVLAKSFAAVVILVAAFVLWKSSLGILR